MRASLVTKALTYGPCTKVRQWLDIQGKALYQCIISKYIMLIKYLATCHPPLTVSGKPKCTGYLQSILVVAHALTPKRFIQIAARTHVSTFYIMYK